MTAKRGSDTSSNGTVRFVLDGEIVLLEGDRASFSGMLKREQATTPLKVAAAAKALPATYVAFDLLYRDHRPLLDVPLARRREALEELLAAVEAPRLVLSEGVVGPGQRFVPVGEGDLVEGAPCGHEVGLHPHLMLGIVEPEGPDDLHLGLGPRAPRAGG